MFDSGDIKVLLRFFFFGVIINEGVCGFKKILINVFSVNVYCSILYNFDIKGYWVCLKSMVDIM